MILTAISIVFSISLYKSAQRTNISSQNLESLEQEVAEIEQEVAQLEESLETAKQPLAKEKIIRNELMMQKPGEYVIQIATEELSNQAKKLPNQEKNLSPWQEWRQLYFSSSYEWPEPSIIFYQSNALTSLSQPVCFDPPCYKLVSSFFVKRPIRWSFLFCQLFFVAGLGVEPSLWDYEPHVHRTLTRVNSIYREMSV